MSFVFCRIDGISAEGEELRMNLQEMQGILHWKVLALWKPELLQDKNAFHTFNQHRSCSSVNAILSSDSDSAVPVFAQKMFPQASN